MSVKFWYLVEDLLIMKNFKVRYCTLFMACAAVAVGSTVGSGATLSLDHKGRISSDLANELVPVWSGDAFVSILSNQTASPTIISFDAHGNQLQPLVFTVPGSRVVDVNGWARGSDGNTVVCGQAYDDQGRGAGFISIVTQSQGARTIRVNPHVPYRCALDAEGGIWSVGLELINGVEHAKGVDFSHGVLRHYDSTGKLMASFVPRQTLTKMSVATWGFLSTARDRVGWYSGPMSGPGSHYTEVSSSGEVREYADIPLGAHEGVTGLALTDDGSTFVSTWDNSNRTWRLFQLGGTTSVWSPTQIPADLANQKWLSIYGGSGESVALQEDRFAFVTLKVAR